MKGKKIIKFISISIFLVFIMAYVIEKSGYYEYNLQDKKNLTEKEIKKFEDDVKKGKDVDVYKYLKNNKRDYSSNLTRATSNFSINLNDYLIKTINGTFDVISRLIK